MKIEYPDNAKDLKIMLIASSQEVSRLSFTVSMQQEQIRSLQQDLQKWERRFDQLLEIR